MAFCIIMGTHTFTKKMDEYEGKSFQCRNCGNRQAYVQKSWKWFTVCWIPVIPFSFGWDKDVTCPVCSRTEDLSHRQDITAAQYVNNAQSSMEQGYGMTGGKDNGGYPNQGQAPPHQQQQQGHGGGAGGYYGGGGGGSGGGGGGEAAGYYGGGQGGHYK